MSPYGYRTAGPARPQYIGLHDPRLGGPEYEHEMAELRRQQAEFREVRRRQDLQNSWMAGVALAPAAVVAGLEAAAVLGARALAPAAPLALPGRVAFPRGGESYAAQVGRRAHQYWAELAKEKRGWLSENLRAGSSGAKIKPDTINDDLRFLIERKPNTPSGLRRGAEAKRRYERETGYKVRINTYDPKDPRWR